MLPLLVIAGALAGCDVRPARSAPLDPAPVADVVLPPTELRVVVFCRLDTDHAGRVSELAQEGFRDIGPLNNDGVNCTHVLFGR